MKETGVWSVYNVHQMWILLWPCKSCFLESSE